MNKWSETGTFQQTPNSWREDKSLEVNYHNTNEDLTFGGELEKEYLTLSYILPQVGFPA